MVPKFVLELAGEVGKGQVEGQAATRGRSLLLMRVLGSNLAETAPRMAGISKPRTTSRGPSPEWTGQQADCKGWTKTQAAPPVSHCHPGAWFLRPCSPGLCQGRGGWSHRAVAASGPALGCVWGGAGPSAWTKRAVAVGLVQSLVTSPGPSCRPMPTPWSKSSENVFSQQEN